MTWRELTDELIEERGHECEFCDEPAVDAHHCIVYRNTKHKKLLDVKYNLVLVCRKHHVQSQDAMRQAWGLLTARYTREVMVAWVEGLDLLVKPRIEWLEEE